jgi:hypothetical protein
MRRERGSIRQRPSLTAEAEPSQAFAIAQADHRRQVEAITAKAAVSVFG